MKKSSLRLFGLLIFFFTSCGQDQEKLLSKIPDPKTLNESYVSNPDHILTAETVAELNSKLRVLDQAGTAHIDVVFVKSIGDLVPKDVAHELFNTWKIGSKETNNGLLMLIVEDQKRIDFETGFGLEGILPDVICYRIQQKYMIPYAKQNDFNGAVKSGVDAVIAHLRNEGAESPVAADTAQYALTDTSSLSVVPESNGYDNAEGLFNNTVYQEYAEPGNIFSLIMAVIYFIFTLAMVRVISKKWLWRIIAAVVLFVTPVAINVYLNLEHPLSWHNGRELLVLYVFLVVFFHLHFLVLNLLTPSALRGLNQHQQYLKLRDTFAPLKWAAKLFALPFLYFFWNSYLRRLEALRYENINCEQCHTALTLMNEDKDNEFLSAGQVKEEEIQSVDYDVWQCNTCFEHTILDYTNLESKAKKCKKCHFTTAVFSRKKVIQRATTSSEGYGCIYYVCAHCREETTEQYTIPKISTSSSSSSSSSGSSSSGSSSSSGGSSGGGGAGSSW